MLIRLMREEDLDRVALIEQQSITPPWSRDGFLQALQQDTLMLVAEDEDREICGYVVMYLAFDEGEITNVAVAPEYRGRQIASLLMEEVRRRALLGEISRIVLEVRFSNEPAIGLYRKMGFSELGIRKNFYEAPVEDARIMEWIIC